MYRIFCSFNLEKNGIILFISIDLAISCSIDRVANPTSRSFDIVEHKWIFISFILEKLRSPVATETGRIKKIRWTITKFSMIFERWQSHMAIKLLLKIDVSYTKFGTL